MVTVPIILLISLIISHAQEIHPVNELASSVSKVFHLDIRTSDYEGNVRNVTVVKGAVFPHAPVLIPAGSGVVRQDMCLYTSFCVGDGKGSYYLIRYTPWYSCELIDGQPNGLLRSGGVVDGQRTSHVFESTFNCSVSVWDVPGNYFDVVGVISYFTEHIVFCDPADDDTIIEVPLERTTWCNSQYMEYPFVDIYNTGVYGYLGNCAFERVSVQFAGLVSHIDLLCENNGVNTSFPVECTGDLKLSSCIDDTIPACETVYYGPHILQYQDCLDPSSGTTSNTSDTIHLFPDTWFWFMIFWFITFMIISVLI